MSAAGPPGPAPAGQMLLPAGPLPDDAQVHVVSGIWTATGGT
jgi:hypothetical protein